MNVSSSYSGISAYPAPTSVKPGAVRPAGRDIAITEKTSSAGLPAAPVKDIGREPSSNPYHPLNQKTLSQAEAKTKADQVRGSLAANDSLSSSTQRALNAYQTIAVQQQREEVTQALGIDVFV